MRRVVAVLVVLILAASAPAAGRQSTDTLSRRLATLGRVWLAVKFGHPRVALSDRDWDSVLATAVPAVRAAKDDAAFEAAVGAMLATLDDPVTRVQNGPDGSAMMGGTPKPLRPIFTALPDGALLVDVRAPGALADPALVREAVTANLEAIARADRLVVDLRGSRRSGWQAARAFEAIGEVLVSEPTKVPSARVVRHAGISIARRRRIVLCVGDGHRSREHGHAEAQPVEAPRRVPRRSGRGDSAAGAGASGGRARRDPVGG